jgi:tetratricopeptide (TPR) repeat protein
MTRSLTGSLREAPAAVPALAAVVLFAVWAASQAGYPLTHWAPGALILLALLAIALAAVPVRFPEIPGAVRLALACLAAYTALSFLSIVWAAAPGEAWEGADRTLLYLIVFALFALWPARGASAALLVGLWTLALVGLAVYVALRLDTSAGGSLQAMFSDERLSYPAGYPNATAAEWLMAFWPALLLARSERLAWALRGLFAAGAVVLADVALLSQSRGSLYATAVTIVLVFAFVPRRLRTFATAIPVVLAIAATTPLLLRVGDRLASGRDPATAVHGAVAAMLTAALLAGVAVAVGAMAESRGALSPARVAVLRRGVGALAVATLVAILAGGLALAGDPVARVRHGWESFEGGYSTAATGNRLLSGLGSNRYDFYRVALDQFAAHPLLGIGADNFQQQYLEHGRSQETPRYPHSIELRTLTQTGILGGALAVLGLGAALLAGWRAMRRRDDALGAAVAAAALAGFAYWAVHGSFDWFFEFAGLGAPAFALLGIACALAPPRALLATARAGGDGSSMEAPPRARGSGVGEVPEARGGEPPPARLPTGRRARSVAGAALAGLLALAAVASLAAPWLSEREVQRAARVWPAAPLAAYARLEDAARLNPLGDRAYLVAGSIALRYGDLARAQRQFSLALGRVPDDAYATLELGAIASEAGRRARALVLLERAVRLDPRDPLALAALRVVRSGKTVGVEALNRSIFAKAEHLT